jgi:ABC-type transport system involved in multi-copper enzyme maturation permease subunit
MSRIWVIATNTFREAVRDRILNSILFFAVLMLGLSLALRELSIGDSDKVVRGVALGGVSLLAAIVALFLGVSLVYKEIERRTIYTLAAKPIARWQLLLGKYLGIWLTLLAEVGLLFLFYVLIVSPQQGLPGAPVFVAMFMLIIELSLLSAWAMLFSTFAAPVTATAYSLCIYVIGHFADDLRLFGERAEPGAFKTTVLALYRVLPNLESFNLRTEAVHGVSVPLAELVWTTAYGVGYTAAVLAVAMLIFTKRDFK